MIIDDTPGISISELRSKCRKYKLEHDLKLIIIDYLQLMSGSGRGSDSRQREISDISRSLKITCKRAECSGDRTVTAQPCRRTETGAPSDAFRSA